MIAKGRQARTAEKRRRKKTPVDVDLTLRFRFGDEVEDVVTVMDDRRVPLVGSVFDSRDAILRGFTRLLVKLSVTQPKIARELVPALRLFTRRRK